MENTKGNPDSASVLHGAADFLRQTAKVHRRIAQAQARKGMQATSGSHARFAGALDDAAHLILTVHLPTQK